MKLKKTAKLPIRARVVSRTEKERLRPITIGKDRDNFSDLYAKMLGASWGMLAITILSVYFAINLLFAFGYYIVIEGIENARPGSFTDVFFFSVQTFATIGYGKMAPVGMVANIMVTFEALTGLCFVAVITGLIFSKFSRPTARLLFSEVAVICPYNGVPHLMIRLANQRGNRIVNASVDLTIMRLELSQEGHRMRRFHDLVTLRRQLPILQLTWTILHPIDEKSPLFNIPQEKLLEDEIEIVVSITGLDETFSQTVNARYSYMADEILRDSIFEDVVKRTEDNRVEINYHLFHKTRPHRA